MRRDLRNRPTDSAGTAARDLRAIALAVLAAAVLVVACDGGSDSQPPGPPGGGGSDPAPGAQRLVWSQEAASPAAIQGYRFILFIDGSGTTLPGASCLEAPGPLNFECSAPLPRLSPGRRVLELSAVDQATGLESPRSAPLAAQVASDGRPAREPDHLADEIRVPSVTCATGEPATCFTVTLMAADIGPVRRLVPLPEGRLLVLLENGVVTLLPSGTSERPEFALRGAGSIVEVADVAADTDFHVNRFLYFATTALAPDGRRTISVVRVRELADRVGEPATIVEGLPAARAGNPVISLGPDRHVYLALPSGSTDESFGYGGHVLRFTREGGGAGYARVGSPILARGRAQPVRLVWDAASRLLIASAELGAAPTLSVVSIGAGGERLGAAIGVAGTDAAFPETRLNDVAAAPPAGTPLTAARVAMIGGNPEVISIATLSVTSPPEIASKWDVPLGSLRPTTLAFASNGDLIVAAARGRDGSGTILLRLRRT